MKLKLPKLPYQYDALQPYMSVETLQIHHDKHHKAYVDNGNKLIAKTDFENMSIKDIILKSHGQASNAGIFNNVAQHYNHVHFWQVMKKYDGAVPGNLEKAIISNFGSMEEFKNEFRQAGATQFGSGWCWLAIKDDKLVVMKTPNGENPLLHGAVILLGCDVWEHSYYIDYRNARPDYLKTFTDNLINWEYVAELYEAAR